MIKHEASFGAEEAKSGEELVWKHILESADMQAALEVLKESTDEHARHEALERAAALAKAIIVDFNMEPMHFAEECEDPAIREVLYAAAELRDRVARGEA